METSLVEWKHEFYSAQLGEDTSLETSLVEWKRRGLRIIRLLRAALGNFLSGMETWEAKGCAEAELPLETSLVEWKPVSQKGKQEMGQPWKLP